MDPVACYLAWLNADFRDRHEYYNDLCGWFQRGGFGFDVVIEHPRGYLARAKLTKLTHTGEAHITYRNGRKAVVRKDTLTDKGLS